MNQSSEPKQLQLVVHAGPLAGKGFPLTNQDITFGRDDDNTIPLDDEEVSRHHSRLRREGNTAIIEDLGSTNGTFVNGKRLDAPHIIQPSDIISIGASVFGIKGFEAPPTVSYAQPSPDRPNLASPPKPPSQPGSGRKPARPTSSSSASWFSGASLLLLGLGFVLTIVILSVAIAAVYLMTQNNTAAVATIPTVVITAPINNSEVQMNLPVTIQATASDVSGIKRVELWVAGQKVDDTTSPSPQGQATLAASFQWTPTTPGNYTLEIKAYNLQGALNAIPTIVTVKVIDPNQPTEAATTANTQATSTPTKPQTIEPTTPSLLVKTDLNVRTGPNSNYDLLGLLPADARAEIIGQDESRQWWKIRFAPANDGTGWVLADPNYSTASNVQNIPIVVAPATPTPTPTITPIPPTATVPPPTPIRATNTPILPTFTPTPLPTNTSTVTPTPQVTKIEFDISPQQIDFGKCTKLVWNITGVKEIYLQEEGLSEQGIPGTGNVERCPQKTTLYKLRVIRNDGVEEKKEITVIVIDSNVFYAGSSTVRPNDRIDVDNGEDRNRDRVDFEWSFEGTIRHFNVMNGARLAAMGDSDSLNDLSKDDCQRADYNKYTFIDASDAPSDPDNTLIPGLAICYTTNDGRTGKLRFPDYSTEDLNVEWVTWR